MFEGSNFMYTTDIFVMNLKSGHVKGPFASPWVFSAHHINAYENSENEIVLDICLTPLKFMKNSKTFFEKFKIWSIY